MPRRAAPSGTVTFLFTDIEGSTRMWEAHPEAMRASLARHDALMREAIGASEGDVFKTIGDAFCAAFATAPQAVESALAAQIALCTEPWPVETPIKVRMALHTGSVESRDDDFFGAPVSRVARLLSTAHGGQCLLSQSTSELARQSLPPLVALKDLGSHQLKDLARPEQVMQLLHPMLPAAFPPIRSLSTHPNNLPQQPTSFIGRAKETEDLESLLERNRLVTLTGSGGTGKSRLSLQVAADSLDRFPDGVWLVELAPLTDPELVPLTVGMVLGLKEDPARHITQTLTGHLKDKHLLLILDNCEHLLDACARVADEVLRNCPRVTILATSRERLGVMGEQGYRVPSLLLPDPKISQSTDSLSQYEAVRLFIERAQLHRPEFLVTNANAPALASICHRLDGIPLAIELAAARVSSLSLDEINDKLDQRFRLLTRGSRNVLPRQQTLRSLVDWSYDLLTEAEAVLLRRLSVFPGGWTLEAAEAVCAGEPVEVWETLELLTSLFDKSLLVVEQHAEETRYHLLETIRQYARDRLSDVGDTESLRSRHLDHFLEVAEDARPHLRGHQQRVWLERLETEHDNMRSALSQNDEGPDEAAKGLRIAAALWRFWLLRGHLSEGRLWLEKRLASDPGIEREVRARALNGAGNLAETQLDYSSARTLHEESLAISQSLGDPWCTAMSLNNLGNGFGSQGDYSTAYPYWKQSLHIWRELEGRGQLGDRRGLAATLDNLGNVALSQGDPAAARALYEECLAIRRELGNQSGIGFSLVNLGHLAHTLGDHVATRAYYKESLQIFAELGDPLGSLYGLEGLAWPGEPIRAARLLGAAERRREELGTPLAPSDEAEHNESVAAARLALNDSGAFDAAWQEGRAMTYEQVIGLALSELGD